MHHIPAPREAWRGRAPGRYTAHARCTRLSCGLAYPAIRRRALRVSLTRVSSSPPSFYKYQRATLVIGPVRPGPADPALLGRQLGLPGRSLYLSLPGSAASPALMASHRVVTLQSNSERKDRALCNVPRPSLDDHPLRNSTISISD